VNFDYQLINEHVLPAFHFSAQQIDFLLETWKKREPVLRDLFPWDDPNYGLDEQWARFYPYKLRAAAGWTAPGKPRKVSIGPREGRLVSMSMTPAAGARGLAVVTADVAFGAWDMRERIEALVMTQ
jgi:hypothetical protein